MSGGRMSGGRLSGGLMSGGLMSAHHDRLVHSQIVLDHFRQRGDFVFMTARNMGPGLVRQRIFQVASRHNEVAC